MNTLTFVAVVALTVVVGARITIRQFTAANRHINTTIRDGLAEIDVDRWEAEMRRQNKDAG